MGEREPERAPTEGAPPAGLGWYARMERQSTPPSQGGPPPAGAPPQSEPPTAVLPAAAPATRPKRRDRRRTPPLGGPAGRPPGRSGNRGLVLWALGALVLAAAAVVAIFFGDDLRGTSSAGSEETTATDQTEPSAPTSGESTAPPTDAGVVPTDTAVPPTGSPTVSDAGGDPLGLGVPMTPPACDGTWIVVLGSATDPASYAADVSALLSADPAAQYVLTEGQCASLRQLTPEGNQIYAVYLGPYPDQASACSISTGVGNGAYVKQMDATIPPEQTWEC